MFFFNFDLREFSMCVHFFLVDKCGPRTECTPSTTSSARRRTQRIQSARMNTTSRMSLNRVPAPTRMIQSLLILSRRLVILVCWVQCCRSGICWIGSIFIRRPSPRKMKPTFSLPWVISLFLRTTLFTSKLC